MKDMLKNFSHYCGWPKALHIYPTEPIVSLMKRRDLIKTFQTSFAWRCSAEATARWAHLTPRRPKAGGLLFPLEGEPTNQTNAFGGGPRSVSLRFNHYLRLLLLPPATLVVKNSLGCCLYYLLKDVALEGRLCGKRRLSAGARWGFMPPSLARLWCMWRRGLYYMVGASRLRDHRLWPPPRRVEPRLLESYYSGSVCVPCIS